LWRTKNSGSQQKFLNLGETLIHYATGSNLDFIGEIFGVYRLGIQIASIAQGDQNFKFYVAGGGTFGSINSGLPITIPAGTQISTAATGGPLFLTDTVFTLQAGDTQQYFSAYAAVPGSSANAAAGVFNQWAGNIPYSKSAFGSLLVTNSYGVVGGRDAETDDNYRYRIQQMLQGRNGANEAAMRFQLLQVPGIQDIVFTRLAGTFDCYVYGIAPTPAPSLLDAVQQRINNNVAFPLTGTAIAPDLVGISLVTTLSVAASLSSVDGDRVISNAVAAAQDYIDNLGVGEQLVINAIADRIRNADSRILDVGQPNKQIPEIFIWRSRDDGTRYSRFLLGNYTPAVGERVVVEVHDGLMIMSNEFDQDVYEQKKSYGPAKYAGCSISSGIYVMAAQAETGCPRPLGRFPAGACVTPAADSGAPGPGKPRLQSCRPLRTRHGARAPGTSNPAIAPERASTEPSLGSHVNAGNLGFGALAAIVPPVLRVLCIPPQWRARSASTPSCSPLSQCVTL
jgi:hypothetical protein